MPEPKESISLYKQGYAFMGKDPVGHIVAEYDIIRDETVEGIRTIVLKERDLKPFYRRVRELADAIAERIGEGESKVVKDLLFDALHDYESRLIDKIYRRVVVRGEPVKPQEGCFKIIVGDGRRRNSVHIMLRE
jgi:hypothetical protein